MGVGGLNWGVHGSGSRIVAAYRGPFSELSSFATYCQSYMPTVERPVGGNFVTNGNESVWSFFRG